MSYIVAMTLTVMKAGTSNRCQQYLHQLHNMIPVTTWMLRQHIVLQFPKTEPAHGQAALPLHIPWHRKGQLPLAALYPAPTLPLESQTLHTVSAHHSVPDDSQWLINFKAEFTGQTQQA